MYKLPIGIRIPSHDEYPSGYDIDKLDSERASANIVEGYRIDEVHNNKFTYFAEINIDADKIWDLYIKLTRALIPERAYGLIAFKDAEHELSDFADRERVLGLFADYKYELTNDGYLEFGIAHYDDISLNEVLVKSFKYLQVWISNRDKFISVMNEFGLLQYNNLQFIDEFPVVSESLTNIIPQGTRHYSLVIEEIKKKFMDF